MDMKKVERYKRRAYYTTKPRVDIFEDDTSITILADLPGVKTEDLSVEVKDNILSIDGKVNRTDKKKSYILMEIDTERYGREFVLTPIVDQTGIEAELKNGVLRITLPKIKEATPHKIKVGG